MAPRTSTFVFVASCLAGTTSVEGRITRNLLHSNKASSKALTDKVSFNGEEIFGSDLGAGSKEVGKCYKTSRQEPLSSVQVCGVNMKAVVYLPNDCEDKDPHNVEVGVCDAGQSSQTCVSVTSDKKDDAYWIDSALSYKIVPCDVQGEASTDDAGPIALDGGNSTNSTMFL